MATTDQLARLDDPALAEFVRRLVEIYHPLRIYLFGSRARGDWGPDSDYDLMIVLPDEAPDEMLSSAPAWDAMCATKAWSDVIVWRHHDFEARLPAKASFPATIVREGRLLYGG